MVRAVALIAGVAAALALLIGCGGGDSVARGGGGGGSAETLIQQLREWAGIAESTGGLRDVTEFRPHLPPLSEPEINSVSKAGVFEGIQAELATDGMTRGTNLESEESKNLACYLMTQAANGELSLDPATLEEQVLGYIGDRFVEQVPQLQFRNSVEDFADAVLEADSGGEAAFNAALATACS